MANKENSLSDYGLKEVKVRLKLDEQDTFMPDVHLDSPADAAEFASRMMRDLDREYTMVVNLDNKLKPINFNIVSIGSINMALTPISNIFKSSILSNAYAMMFFHNHPSGNTYPSQQDIDMTKK